MIVSNTMRAGLAALLLCLTTTLPAMSQVGFSVGIFELYAPNPARGTTESKSAALTLIQPRLFGTTKTRNTQFQYDYAFGYRSGIRGDVHSSDHSATAGFAYRLSRATLQVSDTFRSAVNDHGALPVSPTPAMQQSSFAQELYVPGERSTTNSVVASVNYRAANRTSVTVFGSFDMFRHDAETLGNSQGIQLGIRSDHQVNKWLFLDSSYSRYVNALDPRFESAAIHRFQLGGIKFKPRRTVEIHFSGGMDSSRLQGTHRLAVSFQAGVAKTSRRRQINFVYHRGVSAAVGPQAALNAHILSASFTESLSPGVRLQAGAGYTRGASLVKDSKLAYFGGNTDLQIAIQEHLSFSVRASYVSQRGTNLPTETPALSRYSITTGFHIH